MKKWIVWLGVLTVAGLAVFRLNPEAEMAGGPGIEIREGTTDFTEVVQGGALQTGVKAADSKNADLEFTEIAVTERSVHKGNLLLVNQRYAVPKDLAASEAVQLFGNGKLTKGFGLLDDSIQLSPFLAKKFAAMVAAARKDGVEHFLISSGFRDNKEQERLFREKGAEYAMKAGHSEHNLGLALDIGSTLDEMKRAPEGDWLQDNAWEHGFILRYPKDKTNITGIEFEPWHYRYVGLPHSAIMQQNGWVLEEYLDKLKASGSLSTKIGGKSYDVYYYPVTADTRSVRVPAGDLREISGDNREGVIVTVFS